MGSNGEDVLEGWAQIIGYLGGLGLRVQERAARRYTKRKDPLPVYRRLGKVVAQKGAIEEWLKRQTIHVSAVGKAK